MNRNSYLLFFLYLIIFPSCSIGKTVSNLNKINYKVKLDTVTFFDHNRNRSIPLAIYKPVLGRQKAKQTLIIFSHGYYQNEAKSNTRYSYLTEFLASKGFYVVSIQHELTTDSLIPNNGIPQIVRRPFWERGADNILFVINKLKKSDLQLNYHHIVLIGHSNGGDMTALFPEKYPNVVDKIITLDNRRMALPKTKTPKVYSLRSSDQPADKGVLPNKKEQNVFGMKIIPLLNTFHNDMDDRANPKQQHEIRNYVLSFLNE